MGAFGASARVMFFIGQDGKRVQTGDLSPFFAGLATYIRTTAEVLLVLGLCFCQQTFQAGNVLLRRLRDLVGKIVFQHGFIRGQPFLKSFLPQGRVLRELLPNRKHGHQDDQQNDAGCLIRFSRK